MRNTMSDANEAVNFSLTKTDYRKWPECHCKVDETVQTAADSVYGQALAEVSRLIGVKGQGYQVKTTGHSLGAVMA